MVLQCLGVQSKRIDLNNEKTVFMCVFSCALFYLYFISRDLLYDTWSKLILLTSELHDIYRCENL